MSFPCEKNISERVYACIDLKSFFASVECSERGLDPFKTNLVVADPSRGAGAICLAITPAMKALGIRNRCRIFEIPAGVEYITALPRMKLYMKYSADIYSTYLEYISPDDIYVYSIDECFIELTPYLALYKSSPKEIAQMLMREVFRRTGICATAGIGTNLFLAKVALDITAKHSPDHIGWLDEAEFRRTLWYHRPITDIWNIGRGIAKRLERLGIDDLHGVAACDEDLLFKEFGVNARFLIDHANGRESCTIKEIHEHIPQSTSLSHSQILFSDYCREDALLVLREMAEVTVLELVEKRKLTDHVSLSVGYSKDIEPPTGGSRKLAAATNSYKKICAELVQLFEETTLYGCPVRRLGISLGNLSEDNVMQLDLFGSRASDEREQRLQEAIISIKHRYGKNSLLRSMSLQKQSTARIRNTLVGGHNGE